MKNFLEAFLENHAMYHSAGMNAQHWESKFDQLAARAKEELGKSEDVIEKARDEDLHPASYPTTAEVSPNLDLF